MMTQTRRSWLGPGLVLMGLLGLLVWLLLRRDNASVGEAREPMADEVAVGFGEAGSRELGIDPRGGRQASIAGTVRDASARPIAGAKVCVWPRASQLAASDSEPRCALAGRDGFYLVDGLLGVRHMVGAMAPGFVPGAYTRGEGAARRDTVDLRPGFAATGIDVVLEGGGVEIHGVVRDLSGGAVEGARVSSSATGTGIAMVESGPEGEFSLWVRPGRTQVWSLAEGYAGASEEGVAPGHHFELFLVPEAVLIGKVVRAGDGSPVAGARVDAEGGASGMVMQSGAVFSDAGGNFRIAGLTPGAYKARAEADDAFGVAAEQVILGLGETSAPIVITAHPAFVVEGRIVVRGSGDGCDAGSVWLRQPGSDRGAYGEAEPDGQLRARGVLPGRHEVHVHCPGFILADTYEPVVVADASVTGLRWDVIRGQAIRGVVVDARGQPVQVSIGAEHLPDPARPREVRTHGGSKLADASGRFEITGLRPGEYRLRVSDWARPRAVSDAPVAVTLPEGQDVDGVRVELPAGGEVRGTVRDAKGQPVPRVQVQLTGVRSQVVPAADDGSFVFPDVNVGEYRVTASRGGEPLRAPGRGDDDEQGEKLEVRAGEVEVVTLVVESADGRISGVVRDADGGAVADAFIEVGRESDSATAAAGESLRQRWRGFHDRPRLTDADGRFVLEGLAPGTYSVRAQRRGGGEGQLEHVALASDVVVTIAETGRLTGTVTLPGGGAPAEFTVRIHDKRSGYYRRDSFFRGGGAWSFAELPQGSYELQVTAGEGNQTLEVSLAAGEEKTDLRVELLGRVRVRGTVIDLEGAPVPGIEVVISASGGFGFGQKGERKHVSDAAGRFEIEGAPVGVVGLMTGGRDGEYQWVSTTLRIAGGQDEVVLAPLRVSRERLAPGQAAGELGYEVRRPDPAADPLTRREVVALVRPGGPAAAAGLQPGDEIVTIDGQDVTGSAIYLHHALTRVPAGARVRLGLARGAVLELTAEARR